jgi:glycosyltransferase involved in cell wall biosynthesis
VSGPAGRDIFIVCNSVDELGGLPRWAHQVSRLFHQRGHRVHLVGITHPQVRHDYGQDLPYATTTLCQEHPLKPWRPRNPLERLNVTAHRRERRRREDLRSVAGQLTAMFRGARPGGVIIAAQVWAMEWVAEADTAGLPVIGMSHESYGATRGSSRYQRVKRYFSDVDRLLLLTREDADAWARDGLSNVDAMPNPLAFAPSQPSSRSAKVVVRLGRLSFEKGFDMLLESWALTSAEHPDWTLRLFGSGPEEDRLRRQADELGLTGRVEFAGQVTDLESALRHASVFALSSREEGLPMSLMEAMVMGVPCVAFDCAPGVREIITDGEDGLLVTSGNTDAFAAALSRLIADAELRDAFGEQARRNVARYSPEEVMRRWEWMFDFVHR